MNISSEQKDMSVEHSSPESNQETSTVQPIRGFIDRIETGFVHGWAVDPQASDGKTWVSMIIDGQHYGLVEANQYRGDLKLAGISDGYSGFSIPLDNFLKEKVGSEVLLSVNDHLVEESKKVLKYPQGNFWVGIDHVRPCEIAGTLVSERHSGEVDLVVLDAGKEIASIKVQVAEGENRFVAYLPIRVFDDEDHLLTVGVKNYPFALWTEVVKLTGLLTPWQYLSSSYKEPGFLSLSNQSRGRYESLRYQIEAVAKGELPSLTVEDVVKCHDVVVKGWENRKDFPHIKLPKFKKPTVSVIVPAYNKFELTYHCVASIALAYNRVQYEVIVADDCSTDKTEFVGDYIENVVHVKNEENLRFLRSCNNAAKYAKGDYIIFLNNDTEVKSYWIDELIAPFKDENAKVGLTGSKLLNLDGSLQEAGGIIWGSGQPWNVGNGANPLAPEFNYTRQADYLTGASMCIRKDVWNEIEGFSTEYVPCYYEDTDIAFKVRDHGYKTIYCPMSEVIHFEGQSHGRDVTKGLKQYQVVNETKFKSKWFDAYKNNGQEGKDLLLQKDRGIDHRVLVLDYATPDASSDAGSYAAVEEIKLLQKLGMKVTFVPENMAHMGKLTHKLQRMGVEVLYAPFYTSVFDVIEKRIGEFNSVYITRYAVAEKYIDAIRARSQAKIVFNNADLHFLRELRAASTTGEYSIEQALDTRKKELEVMSKVDAILSYNETEHAVIMSHNLRGDNIFRCPWVLSKKTVNAPFKDRSNIAFLGGFRHHPNVEAVKHFANQVLPEIIKVDPTVKFHIYGSNPTDEIEALASDNIVVEGFVENLDDVFLKHKVIVAPLLSGAGIKGKVLEAMSYGAPQVMTKVASEATGLSHKISAWIQDDKKAMAEGVLTLMSDEAMWNKFSENSRIIVDELYSEETGVKMMREVFKFVGIYTR